MTEITRDAGAGVQRSHGFNTTLAALASGLILGVLAWPIASAAWSATATGTRDSGLVAAADGLARDPAAARWRLLGERYLAAARDAAPDGQRFYDELARDALARAAAAAPAHARTWLQLTELVIRLDGLTPHAASLLARASAAAPARPAFVDWRARRVLRLWSLASPTERRVLADQVARAWRADPDGIGAYAASIGRDDVLEAILGREQAGEG